MGSVNPRAAERVLIVDDNEAVRRSAADVLRSAGYPTREAADVGSALALLGEDRYDLVVVETKTCDDGAVDRFSGMADPPAIIVMSSEVPAEPGEATSGGPVRQFLRKPVLPRILIDAVAQAIDGEPL